MVENKSKEQPSLWDGLKKALFYLHDKGWVVGMPGYYTTSFEGYLDGVGYINTRASEKQLMKALFGVEDEDMDITKDPFIGLDGEFYINPLSRNGKAVQREIDYAFDRAMKEGRIKKNPDTGLQSYSWPTPTLKDVYFDHQGNFEDLWNIGLDSHESPYTFTNFVRSQVAGHTTPPTVRGKANIWKE